MRRLIIVVLIVLSQIIAVGQTIADIVLPNVVESNDFSFSSVSNQQTVVVIFYSGKCAYGEYYLERILSLAREFSKQKVRFVLVNSNSSTYVEEESLVEMKKFSAKHQIDFPYLADKEKKLKSRLRASRTPEVFVLEPKKDFAVYYRGAIDDNAQSASDVGHEYLKEALVNLLAGKNIEVNQTRPVGCLIK